jgi:molecular chaperone GrpE
VAFTNEIDEKCHCDESGTCTCDGCKCDENGMCICGECSCGDQKMSEFEGKIKVAEEKTVEMESKLVKVLADYANLEKDIIKRSDFTLDQLKIEVAKELISIIDDVNFAMASREKLHTDDATKSWIDGLLTTLNKMSKALEKLDVKSLESKEGDRFNSDIHEAVGVINEGTPGTVAKVVQQGFVIGENNKIVRPARVIVAKK